MRIFNFYTALLPALFLGACVQPVDRRATNTPNRVVPMSILFDHGKHVSVIEKNKLNCLSCHPDKTALKDVIQTKDIGKKFICHDCHRNSAMWGEASQRCELCHADLSAVLPPDHRLDWKRRHSIFAKLDDGRCSTCHDRVICTNCHLQRDTFQQTVHPRTFQVFHSVEARANPHACGSCHQIDFCRNCHMSKGVTF